MNLMELLTTMARQYPCSVDISVRVDYLNQALVAIEEYFDIYATARFNTVADQDGYAFPAGIESIDQIYSLGVSTSPSTLENRYDFVKYQPTTVLDFPATPRCYYELMSEDGVPMLMLYPVPDEDDHIVSITYKVRFTPFDSSDLETEQTPIFDSRYHILLAYYANSLLASSGHAPDEDQHDINMQRWLSGLEFLQHERMNRRVRHPRRRKDNRQWRGPQGHASALSTDILDGD